MVRDVEVSLRRLDVRVSEDQLDDSDVDRDVEIVIRKKPRSRSTARIRVVAA